MKTLTLTQPWATLVMCGAKSVETRSWQTSYRGQLAIHAAKRWELADMVLASQLIDLGVLPIEHLRELPRGVVLGTVNLRGIVRTEEVRWTAEELRLGDFTPGRFAWLLDSPEYFEEPIPARGYLGLWHWRNDS